MNVLYRRKPRVMYNNSPVIININKRSIRANLKAFYSTHNPSGRKTSQLHRCRGRAGVGGGHYRRYTEILKLHSVFLLLSNCFILGSNEILNRPSGIFVHIWSKNNPVTVSVHEVSSGNANILSKHRSLKNTRKIPRFTDSA